MSAFAPDGQAILRALQHGSPVGLAAVGLDGAQTYVNQAFCAMLGFEEAELIGQKPPFPYWPAKEVDAIRAAFAATLEGRAPAEGVPLQFSRKDGGLLDVRIFVAKLAGADGSPQGWLATVVDVTARVQEEEVRKDERQRLHAEERERLRLHSILEQLPAGVMIADRTGAISYSNPAAARIFGSDIPSPAGATEYDRTFHAWSEDGSVLPSDRYPIVRGLRGEAVVGEVVQFERPDRSRAWVRVNATALRDPKGEITGAITTYFDITELRSVQAQQDQERQRLYLTFQHAPVALAVFRGAEHRFELANTRYEEMVGRGSLAGNTVGEAFPELPSDHPVILSLTRAFNGESVVVTELLVPLRRGGNPEPQEAWFTYSLQPFRGSDGSVLGSMVAAVEVTEQVQARLKVDALRAAAEAANRTKDEFLAILGHELRNPLAPILTALQLLRVRGIPGGETERAVIERQVQHLLRLVDDLLDVARVARGKIELRRKPAEVREIVESAVELASPMFEAKVQRVELEVDRGLAVNADPTRLRQALANLLVNAARYTHEGGNVAVRARRDGAEVRIDVQDDGIGIAPELLPRIFEMFVQGERRLDRSQGGLGLGLAIVKSLVALHGGRVEAHSEGLGKGSTFTIWLAALERGVRHDEEPRPRPPKGHARRKVLVVDDNEDAAFMLSEAIRGFGHEVATASDGPAAIASAIEFRPDVALLDLGLPVMDGFELARRLHAIPGLESLKLVAVTGYGQTTDRQRSLDAGFSEHLVKPVDLEDIAALLLAATSR